jgi:hypothetical protein
MAKVSGSGLAIMSDSSILANPSIEERQTHPLLERALQLVSGDGEPLQNPSTSVNHRRMNLTLCSFTSLRISAVVFLAMAPLPCLALLLRLTSAVCFQEMLDPV